VDTVALDRWRADDEPRVLPVGVVVELAWRRRRDPDDAVLRDAYPLAVDVELAGALEADVEFFLLPVAVVDQAVTRREGW
jgi:hypothetical protein